MMRKIKLINWHGFFNDSIDVNGALLVTGDNGSGKSTLLDAIFFLLTGGDDNRFNAAANENANRTLTSYMRGKTGIEGKQFLRNSPDLISHIALEFFDDSIRAPFTIGVVLEIQEGTEKVGRNFYHIKNTGIDDNFYTVIDQSGKLSVCNFQIMKRKLGSDILNPISGSKKDIRRSIYSILSLENKRYYELLPKAIAFKPISDVNDFVYQFLMPQKDVDIENVRQNVRAYNDIRNKIATDEEKKGLLNLIKENADIVNENTLQTALLSALKTDRSKERYENDIAQYERTISESEVSKAACSDRKDSLKQELEFLSRTIYDLENKESYRALREITDRLEKEKRRLSDCRKKESEFKSLLLAEENICAALKLKRRFSSHINERDFAALSTAASSYSTEIDELKESLSNSIYDLSNRKKEQEDGLEKLMNTRRQLEQGLQAYSVRIEELISAIQERVMQRYSEQLVLKPLCEYLEFKQGTEGWRNAIEGTLADRRFDLMIPHRFYEEALAAYKENRFSREIDRIGIVDSDDIRKATAYVHPQGKETLSDFISTDNELAAAYLKLCIGDIICADEESLGKETAAVTQTCMLKKDDYILQIDPASYRTPYIGKEAIRIKLEETCRRIEEVQKLLESIREELSEKERTKRMAGQSKVGKILSYSNIWAEVDNAKSTVDILQNQYDKLKTDAGTIVLDIEHYRDEKARTERNIESVEEKIRKLSTDIELARSKGDECREKKNVLSAELETSLKENDIARKFLGFKEKNRNMKEAQIASRLNELSSTKSKAMNAVISDMTKYIERYSFDATANMDSFNIFCKELNDVVTRELVTFQQRLDETRENAAKMFQNSYIADIRKHIKDEKRNIAKLNKALENKPFGYDGEIYQFVVGKSRNKSFADYYDIFIGDENYTVDDLFTNQLSSRHASLMQELFEKLTADSTEVNNLKIINQYTDYRSFMSYDIKIRNKRGEESYFSKVNKEKSGGETQTPFYVIIAASFDQLIRSSYGQNSSGCLIMLDEAFNNMDEAHIDSMMKYFRQLDIQPIIAVPTQRARTIFPYVDTAIALAKIRDRVYVRPFMKAEHHGH
ncbi:MAG: hypothetical protein IJ831_05960 [Spirochaetales bacterium]|nr:hypothetical protein [Spirochaetales bacterium]